MPKKKPVSLWRTWTIKTLPEDKIAGEIAAIEAASRRWIGERGRKKSNPVRGTGRETRDE